MLMENDGAIVTHHEAGHTVAALMTLSIGLGEGINVALVGGGDSHLMMSGDHVKQSAFVIYAGPWAETRLRWGGPVQNLESTNDDGETFRDAIKGAFDHVSDGSDGELYAQLNGADPSIPKYEPSWSLELERAWPVICELASVLQAGLRDAEPKPHPFATLYANPHLTTKFFSMPSHDVLALVQPLLEDREMWRYVT